jgi:hypothetical protein
VLAAICEITRGVAAGLGTRLEAQGECGDADEHADRQRAHDRERVGGVAGFGFAECWDAVADRLDSGERGTAGGERAHQQHQREQATDVRGAVQLLAGGRGIVQGTGAGLDRGHKEHQVGQRDEQVGRDGEDPAGLLDAAQVREQQQHHEPD